MNKIIANIPNPLTKCAEYMLVRIKVENIIKSKKLSDEEKVEKIMRIIKRNCILNNIVVY